MTEQEIQQIQEGNETAEAKEEVIDQMAEIGLDLNIQDFQNLDGGGSVDCLDEDGKHLDEDGVGSRKVDTQCGLFRK